MRKHVFRVEDYYRLEKVENLRVLNVTVLHDSTDVVPFMQRPYSSPEGHVDRVVGSLLLKKPNGEFELILAIQQKRWSRRS